MSDKQSTPPDAGRMVPLRGRRALVAEASTRVRGLLRDVLRGLGAAEVIEVHRGGAAVEELRVQRYDLAVIGQVDGDAYDTQLTLEKIREDRLLPAAATLVAIASDRAPRTITGIASFGPDTCLVKPLLERQIRLRLIEVVAHKDRLRPVIESVENGDWGTALELCRLFELGSVDLRLAGYRAICEHLIERNQPEQARAVLDEARAMAEVPWIELAEARLFELGGQAAQARELLVRLVGERPEFIASYDALASIESGQGEFAVALGRLQQANARTGFNLRRMRNTGEIAARGGDLLLAEKALDRVMQKVRNSDLARGSDYVQLVDVLSARGKHERAGHLVTEMRRTQPGDPDVAVAALLARFRKARNDDDVDAESEVFREMTDAYTAARTQISLGMLTELMEAFVLMGERELALDAARTVAVSGRADRARLDRVREVLRT